MSSISRFQASRSSGVKGSVNDSVPLFLPRLIALGRDADLVEQPVQGQLAADHADRAGQRAGLGEDLACRPSRCNSRRWPRCRPCWRSIGFLERHDFAPDQVAGQRRAAGAVDAQHDGFDLGVSSAWRSALMIVSEPTVCPPNKLDAALAGHDRADDIDHGDLVVLAGLAASSRRPSAFPSASSCRPCPTDRSSTSSCRSPSRSPARRRSVPFSTASRHSSS